MYTALVNEALARGRNHRVLAHPANERLAPRYRELGFVDVPDGGNPRLMFREPDPTPATDTLTAHEAPQRR